MLLEVEKYVADFKKKHSRGQWTLLNNHYEIMDAFRFDFNSADQDLPWIFNQERPLDREQAAAAAAAAAPAARELFATLRG